MPYTNVDIFREKGAEILETTEFYEKMGKKIRANFFVVN
jgi:hypothetical protein